VVVTSPLEHQQLGIAAAPTYWHRVRYALVIDETRRFGGRQVLDVGAGAGLLGDWVVDRHPDLAYHFVETSPRLRNHLIERFGAGAEADEQGRIPAGTMVALLDVVEHIADDVTALRQLRERMGPGSRVIVTVPAMRWAYSSWDVALGHFRRYTRTTLDATLRQAGFTTVTTCYLFPELLPLLVVRRMRPAGRAHADFPVLPHAVDAIGYRIASLTARTRRWWPFGTSVVAVATLER
jgi:hypothetical protein